MPTQRHLGAVASDLQSGAAASEPQPVQPPAWLDDDADARAVWDRLAPVVPAGKLTPATAESFALVCVAVSTYAEAHSLVATTGLLVAEGQSLIPNQALGIRTQHDGIAQRGLKAFGLTPDDQSPQMPRGPRRLDFSRDR